MHKRNPTSGDAEAIAERLRLLAQEHSLTGLAKRVDIPASNLHRYINGTRVPADVCAKIARELSLNTGWLLHGTGAASLGDVSPDTSAMADSLLELVRAMTAVEHLRMGALTGKHHLRVLRELGDAMTRYEGLRRRLNERSVPVLRAVLDRLRDALDKSNIEVAIELSGTAEQLGRLSDDPALLRELALLRGRTASFNMDLLGVLTITRKFLMLAIHDNGDLGGSELESLAETVNFLIRRGCSGDARRIARSALELASPDARQSQGGQLLKANLAHLEVLTGELPAGLKVIAAGTGQSLGQGKTREEYVLMVALLYAGTLDVPGAIAFGRDSYEKAMSLYVFSALIEDEVSLAHAKEYWNKVRPSLANKGIYDRHGELVLKLLRGKTVSASAVQEIIEQPALPKEMPLDWHVMLGTQLFRLMGRNDEARRCFRKSCQNIAHLPDWFTLIVPWQARHQRNALELGTKAQQQEAREWFKRHVDLGYRCFAQLASPGSPKQPAS